LAQKKPGLIGGRRDREAVCLCKGTSCGGKRPQVEACSKTSMRGRNGSVLERGRETMGW